MGPASWQEPWAAAPADLGITTAAGRAIAQLARDAFPREFVAVLGARNGTIAAIAPLANRAGSASAVAFAADPVAFARAEHELRGQGLTFLGFVHSHPDGTPVPSAADRAGAWPGCAQLIVGVDARAVTVPRAFVPSGADLVEVPLLPALARDGCELHDAVFGDAALAPVEDALAALRRPGRAGVRHLLREPAVAALAHDARLRAIAAEALGPGARPFRATLFAKAPGANWLVAWHQDTALPFRVRRDAPGYGPWSTKAGIACAHAPTAALTRVLALRVHLDACDEHNGALRVLPGSHRLGVLDDEAAAAFARAHAAAAVCCAGGRGSVLAMAPLVLHASSKATSTRPRRVLHIEYAPGAAMPGGLELADC